MVTDYEVITALRIADLQDRVREKVKAGWSPVGGIAVVHEEQAGEKEPHMVFAQALVAGQLSR